MLTTHFFPKPVDSRLWPLLVDAMDEGIIVLGSQGTVDYANEEAGRLLGYSKGDVIGLDLEDFAALCYAERLDGRRFAAAVKGLAKEDDEFEVMGADHRLRVRIRRFEIEEERFTVLMMREITGWRAHMVARATLGDNIQSPLIFAASYAEMLATRIEQKGSDFEINDLVRIVRESLFRALSVIKWLRRLYDTDPATGAPWRMEAHSLHEAYTSAILETAKLDDRRIRLHLKPSLAPVQASPPHLHSAFCALLEESLKQVGRSGYVVISGEEKGRNVYSRVTLHNVQKRLSSSVFDRLPCAITEQTIIRHGGRIWIEHKPKPTFGLMLPAADEGDT